MGLVLKLAGWREALAELQRRVGELFGRPEPRRQAGLYLEGLLGPAERKNGWQLAEAIGDRRPWRTQRVLSHVLWDQDKARDLCRGYVVEHLGAPDGVLILDETGFLKKGTRSAGVARQYSGTAGRVENCQIGVFLAYASAQGHALIDRELYLPKEWTDDRARCTAAAVPEAVEFATKPRLAQRMIERALTAGVPVAGVPGDEVYGNDRRLRLWLEQHDRPHVLAVKAPLWALVAGQGPIPVPAKELAAVEPREGWRRLSAGAKGERLYDWARFRLFRLQQAPWDHWLLVRRKLSKPDEMAYYVVFGPATTSLETLARIGAGRSRSASRQPNRRSGWTATRCAAGMAGTGTSLCRCWRSPFWRRCGSTSPPKRGRKIRRIHCLQHARDPSPHQPLPAERRPLHRLHSRLVALAPDPSGRRQSLPLETTDRQTPDLPASSTVVLIPFRKCCFISILSFRPTFVTVLVLQDRKSTRLNSSHPSISYAVFCLKKKKQRYG